MTGLGQKGCFRTEEARPTELRAEPGREAEGPDKEGLQRFWKRWTHPEHSGWKQNSRRGGEEVGRSRSSHLGIIFKWDGSYWKTLSSEEVESELAFGSLRLLAGKSCRHQSPRQCWPGPGGGSKGGTCQICYVKQAWRWSLGEHFRRKGSLTYMTSDVNVT